MEERGGLTPMEEGAPGQVLPYRKRKKKATRMKTRALRTVTLVIPWRLWAPTRDPWRPWAQRRKATRALLLEGLEMWIAKAREKQPRPDTGLADLVRQGRLEEAKAYLDQMGGRDAR